MYAPLPMAGSHPARICASRRQSRMRQSQKSNRPRNKNGRKPNSGPSPNRVYESSGPEGKVRGTPQQIVEKYQSLARDKSTAGDRVMAENFLQHAEHYMRILTAAQPQRSEERDEQRGGDHRFDDAEEGDAAIESLAVIGENDQGEDGAAELVETPESAGERREDGADNPNRRRGRRPTRRARAEGDDEGDESGDASSRPRRRRAPRGEGEDSPAMGPADNSDDEPVRAAE